MVAYEAPPGLNAAYAAVFCKCLPGHVCAGEQIYCCPSGRVWQSLVQRACVPVHVCLQSHGLRTRVSVGTGATAGLSGCTSGRPSACLHLHGCESGLLALSRSDSERIHTACALVGMTAAASVVSERVIRHTWCPPWAGGGCMWSCRYWLDSCCCHYCRLSWPVFMVGRCACA